MTGFAFCSFCGAPMPAGFLLGHECAGVVEPPPEETEPDRPPAGLVYVDPD